MYIKLSLHWGGIASNQYIVLCCYEIKPSDIKSVKPSDIKSVKSSDIKSVKTEFKGFGLVSENSRNRQVITQNANIH